jgi:exonuclease 3'-5' domain-containing protein 1
MKITLGCLIRRQQDLMTFLKMHSHLFRVTAGKVSLIPLPRLQQPSSPSKRVTSSTEGSSPHLAQSLKQRVNSVVLKVLADNSDRDKTSPTPSNGQPTPTPTQQQQQQQNQDDHILRANIFQRSRVILSHRESVTVLEEVIRRGEAVAVDCEGVNLSTPVKGQITLVQLGVMSGQAYVLDVATDPKIWDEGRLKAVLECNHVVKVIHDCRNLSSVLNAQLGIKLCNVFDAQVIGTLNYCMFYYERRIMWEIIHCA